MISYDYDMIYLYIIDNSKHMISYIIIVISYIISYSTRFRPEMESRNASVGPDSATVIRVRILLVWLGSSESTIPTVTVL
jgi:hypothetical protein